MWGFEPRSAPRRVAADFNQEVTVSYTSFKICMTEKNLKKRFVLLVKLGETEKTKWEGSHTRSKSFPLLDTDITCSM